jgi:hypothetical protein
MTPKEKAAELIAQFKDVGMSADTSGGVTKYERARKCALIAVDEIISALERFAYNRAMYDDFETGRKVFTYDVDPAKFWNEVKREIESV